MISCQSLYLKRANRAEARGLIRGLSVKKAGTDSGKRPTDVPERLEVLEHENRQLRPIKEILRKAFAHFTRSELDRQFQP